jgi:hypothetical protein
LETKTGEAMKTNVQLKTDRYLGWLLCVVLRIFVRFLGFVLRINHQLERKFDRIVVCKFKGMGSIVQASALLKSLRDSFPDAEIVFVSSQANAGILEAYPDQINRRILVNDSSLFGLTKTSASLL